MRSECIYGKLLIHVLPLQLYTLRYLFRMIPAFSIHIATWLPVVRVLIIFMQSWCFTREEGRTASAPPPKNVEQNILEYVDRKKGTLFFKLTTC